MKRIDTLIFLAIIFLLSTGGCSSKTLNCSEDTKTINRPLSKNITRITSYSWADIEYRVGEPKIEVTGDARDVDRVKILEKGSTLDLRSGGSSIHSGKGPSCPLKVIVTLPELQGLTLSGAGDFSATKISTKSFEINLTGSGDITLGNVSTASTTINISGAGDVKVKSIDTNYLQFLCRGAGDIDINSVKATTFKTALHGAGDINIGRLDGTSAEVMLSGAGDLKYRGITLNILNVILSGAGDITLEGKCSQATLNLPGIGEIDAKKLRVDHLEKRVSGIGEINL